MEPPAEAEGQAPEMRKWGLGGGSGEELVAVRIQVGNWSHRSSREQAEGRKEASSIHSHPLFSIGTSDPSGR